MSTPDSSGNPELRLLEARSTELAALAGGLAHEIRNPLSTIAMNLDLLAEEIEHDESGVHRRLLGRIRKIRGECENLENVLNAFLQFARAGQLTLQPCSLNQLVSEYAAFLEPQAAARNVELRVHVDAELPKIPLDAGLMRQVLANLSRNALEAMPDGGTLELIISSNNRDAVVEVIDTGSGMTPRARERMFDAFFSTRNGGSGLGLSTVRKIVEAHHGTIQCDSEPGRGTRFTISLPLNRQPK